MRRREASSENHLSGYPQHLEGFSMTSDESDLVFNLVRHVVTTVVAQFAALL